MKYVEHLPCPFGPHYLDGKPEDAEQHIKDCQASFHKAIPFTAEMFTGTMPDSEIHKLVESHSQFIQ